MSRSAGPPVTKGPVSVRQDRTADGRGRPSAQDTGSSSGQDTLAVQLSDLARALQQQDDPQRTLTEIVQAAAALIPGCDEGSISVVTGRRHVRSEAASCELARVVDALQEQTGQGPCLDAAYQHQTVRVADLASEQRCRSSPPALCRPARPGCWPSSPTSRARTSAH